MNMATVSAARGDISVAFLQQNGDNPFTATPERTAQVAGVAKLIADFIAGARTSLDIAIYDFRLDGDAAAIITAALHERARNNVAIRVIYDATTEPQANGNGEVVPAHLEADRKSPGTEIFVNSFADIAQIKPVTGYRVLMHSKYLIRDAGSDSAAVLLGSANYTNNSWGLQESNLLQIRSRPLASIFTDNFAGLFATGRVPENQTNRDVDSVNVSGVPVNVGFAPKQSPAIVKEIVGAISCARKRLFVASGVVSSGPILAALSEAIDRGMQLGGLYDRPQMDLVRRQWHAGTLRMSVPTRSIPGTRLPTISWVKTRCPTTATSRSRTISCTTSLSSLMTSWRREASICRITPWAMPRTCCSSMTPVLLRLTRPISKSLKLGTATRCIRDGDIKRAPRRARRAAAENRRRENRRIRARADR